LAQGCIAWLEFCRSPRVHIALPIQLMAFRAEMVCRTTVLSTAVLVATLPLSGATTAPGCGCLVSSCCNNQFNDTFLDPAFFSTNVFPEPIGWSMTDVRHGDQESGGYLPACSLLNLLGRGVCSDPAVQNVTVCEAISASADATSRLRGGGGQHSVLSAFLEPGTCDELQAGECWEQRPGNATYSWRTGRPNGCWAQGLSDAAVLWDMTCGDGDGEVRIRAEWLDDAKHSDDHGSCEGRNYSADATFPAEGWNGSSDSPRWQCLDIPGGDYRIFMYSIGQTPCLSTTTTPATTTTPDSSGSSSVGMDSFAGAMVAVAGVGFVLAPWSNVPWP